MIPNLTRDNSYIMQFNQRTSQVRSWYESYDHTGKVNRVHPKTIDGQHIIGQHYPPTGAELKSFSKKIGALK